MANSSLESVIKVNGSIVSELSERIPSNIVALNELIKNSYDAGSPSVEIIIDSTANILKVIDKGEGMDKKDIDTLFHLSKSTKQFGKYNEKYKRYVQGSKGLGFLSVFKFGRKVEWRTKKDVGYKFSVDFDKLLHIDNISDYHVQIDMDESIPAGTEITIDLTDESKILLLDYLEEKKNYSKIVNSFTDEKFLIILNIDGKKFRSNSFKGIKDHFRERQLFYVDYDSDLGVINYYHNNFKVKTVPFKFDGTDYKCKLELSIYKFKTGQKANIYNLFYNSFNELTPLIFVNDNLFNNFDLFDPSVMKTIKTGEMLNQMVGYVKIYSDSTSIQFNSDRTKFAQNLLTDKIIKFLKELNITIQREGSKFKQYLVDNDFLKIKQIESKNIDLNDINALKNYIKDDFAFKDKVNINISGNKILYSVFNKCAQIEILNSSPVPIPADIVLKSKFETITVPSKQINLAEYIIKATDSKGNNIIDKVDIKVDGVKSDTKILESIVAEKTVCIEYSYLDSTTNLITQQLVIVFKAQTNPLVGTYSNENYLLYVEMKKGYTIQYNNTISKLINQINNLTLEKNREVIACSLRVLFELSVKCLVQSSKNLSIKNNLTAKVFDDIKLIVEFCQQTSVRTEIAKNTKIPFDTLKNILIVNDFIDAFKKSNLGPHSSTSYLEDVDIKFIAKKAAYFVVFINELINNPNII
jgi:hypothetical protein